MSWTLDSSGTQTATIGTLHTLATSTNNGTFCFEVDLSSLAPGETVLININGITLTGGTAGLMWPGSYTGGQLVAPRVQSMGIASDISISVTLKQVNGTGRAFPWKLLRA